MKIRKYQKSDWDMLWPIIEKVFRKGDTYAYATDISEEDAYKVWVELPQQTFVLKLLHQSLTTRHLLV